MTREIPLYERDPAAWHEHLAEGNRTQPRKRVGADVLFRDTAGSILLVDPRYKPDWDLPGGMAEANEAPATSPSRLHSSRSECSPSRRPQAWFGNCTGHQTATTFNAYCEGARPSSFAGSAWCRYSDGYTYQLDGPWRWAGEGLGSYLACNSGSSIVDTWITKID